MRAVRTLLYIFYTLSAIAILSRCSSDETAAETGNDVAATLAVNITDNGNDDSREKISTVRVIVFDDMPYSPKLDVNEFIDEAEITNNDGISVTPTGFTANLQVSVNNNKMVVIIANEPSSSSAALNAVHTPSDVEAVMFDMGQMFTANHTGFLPNVNMPMSGAIRGVVVTAGNDNNNPARANLTLERALARVDVYLKAATGSTAEITASTKITLERTYDEGYLAVGTEADGTRYKNDDSKDFGKMLTVAPAGLIPAVWSPGGSHTIVESDGKVALCSFYTPERSCTAAGDADRLVIDLSNIGNGSGMTGGRVVFDKFNGMSENMKYVKRNNTYEITATVKEKIITVEGTVVAWKKIPENIIIDKQFELSVSHNECVLSGQGGDVVITAETDYDVTDQGFPEGLLVSLSYTPQGGPQWMTLTDIEGTENSLKRRFRITAADNAGNERYGEIIITAGNMTKKIKVTQFKK